MMQQFIESPRFLEGIAYGSGGGLEFYKSRAVTPSGQRKVNIRRAQPLGVYNVALEGIDQDVLEELQAFHMNTYGGAIPFRFKDWLDYEVGPGQGVIKLDPQGRHQLYKRYALGGHTFDRLIQKPVEGTVTLTGGLGTLDYTTGLLTNCSATGWEGEFDVPVAFQSDALNPTIDDEGTYSASLVLEIVRLKT